MTVGKRNIFAFALSAMFFLLLVKDMFGHVFFLEHGGSLLIYPDQELSLIVAVSVFVCLSGFSLHFFVLKKEDDVIGAAVAGMLTVFVSYLVYLIPYGLIAEGSTRTVLVFFLIALVGSIRIALKKTSVSGTKTDAEMEALRHIRTAVGRFPVFLTVFILANYVFLNASPIEITAAYPENYTETSLPLMEEKLAWYNDNEWRSMSMYQKAEALCYEARRATCVGGLGPDSAPSVSIASYPGEGACLYLPDKNQIVIHPVVLLEESSLASVLYVRKGAELARKEGWAKRGIDNDGPLRTVVPLVGGDLVTT